MKKISSVDGYLNGVLAQANRPTIDMLVWTVETLVVYGLTDFTRFPAGHASKQPEIASVLRPVVSAQATVKTAPTPLSRCPIPPLLRAQGRLVPPDFVPWIKG